MSEIRVDSIKNQAGTGSPNFPIGLTVAGIITASAGIVTYYGDGSKLTGISVGTTAATAGTATTATNVSGGFASVTQLSVSGLSTFNGITTYTQSVFGTNLSLSGIITATTLNGTHTGTWNGVGIGTTFGGTGITTYASGDILYSSATNTLTKLPIGLNGQVLTVSSGLPSWATSSGGGGTGSGFGLFNTGITTSVGYAVTTGLTAAFTAPSTSGYRYIIHSVQVTNITTTSASITGDFTGSTYTGNVPFAFTIPIQPGNSIELLKKPKVLNPNDAIRFSASALNSLHVTITYQTILSTSYLGIGTNVTGVAATDLYSASANSMIESVLLINNEGTSDVKATVTWTNSSNVIQGYYVYELVVPADASVEILEAPKYIANGNKVRVTANVANRLSAIIAGITL